MTPIESALLTELTNGAEPKLLLRTHTRIDAGLWWRKISMWICVVDAHLIMLAVARRRYAEKIAIAECPDSHYNPATGELVIAPGENLRFNRIKVSPRQAIQILKFLNPQSVSKTLQN